jgi:hypothetical protein
VLFVDHHNLTRRSLASAVDEIRLLHPNARTGLPRESMCYIRAGCTLKSERLHRRNFLSLICKVKQNCICKQLGAVRHSAQSLK